MKKSYTIPVIKVININQQDIICTSNPYGPDSVIIPVGGTEGDEEIAPPPPGARGMWKEW